VAALDRVAEAAKRRGAGGLRCFFQNGCCCHDKNPFQKANKKQNWGEKVLAEEGGEAEN
jgi:hypothetical protein